MRIRLLFIQLVLFALSVNLNASENDPRAVKGVFDLREIVNRDQFIVKLNGEWEFYWGKLLYPLDFKTGSVKPDYYGKVPSYWTDYPQESVKTEKFGYATYRLTILLPQGFNKYLGIDLPVFDSSYDLYINGKYFVGNGLPGKSVAETKPGYKRNFYIISPESDTLKLLIHVSNYDHRRGGFFLFFPVLFSYFTGKENHGFFWSNNTWSGPETSFYF
jgi:hypothetical protein